MMTLKENLLTVCKGYAAAKSLSHSRVSTLVFGDGKVVSRLQGDSDLTTSRYEAAMQWFSNHWPVDALWPENVARPSPVVVEAAE